MCVHQTLYIWRSLYIGQTLYICQTLNISANSTFWQILYISPNSDTVHLVKLCTFCKTLCSSSKSTHLFKHCQCLQALPISVNTTHLCYQYTLHISVNTAHLCEHCTFLWTLHISVNTAPLYMLLNSPNCTFAFSRVNTSSPSTHLTLKNLWLMLLKEDHHMTM